MFNFKKESGTASPKLSAEAGQVSKLLLVLAVIVLVAAIITFLILRMAEKPAPPPITDDPNIPLSVYEQTLGDIRFVFLSAIDRGTVLRVSEVKNTSYSYSARENVTALAGGKFIQVSVGAQNMGRVNIEQRAWDIGNIIDSEAREYEPLERSVEAWLPENNFCGSLLKPAFDPAPCTKIYEVSKEATGLKVRVVSGQDNSPGSLSSKKTLSADIDLIVR